MKKIMTIILTITLALTGVLTASATAENIVKDKVVNLTVNDEYIIKDGELQIPTPAINIGDKFKYESTFSYTPDTPFKDGDMFMVEILDTKFFEPTSFGNEYEIIINNDGVDEVVGTYTFEDIDSKTYAVFTVNELAEKYDELKNLTLEILGSVVQNGEDINIGDDNNVNVGDEETGNPSDPEPSDPVLPGFEEDPTPVSKIGVCHHNRQTLRWEITINADVGVDYFRNPKTLDAIDTKRKAYIIDDLQDGLGLKIGDITLSTILRLPILPTSDGGTLEPSSKYYIPKEKDISETMQKLENTLEETYDQFKTRVLSQTVPTIGLFDEQRVIIQYGDIPSYQYDSILGKLSNTQTLAEDFLSKKLYEDMDTALKAAEIVQERYYNGKNDNTTLEFVVKLDSHVYKEGDYKNLATLYYNNTKSEDETHLFDMKDSDVYGDGRIRGALKVIKYDYDLDAKGERVPLENVAFKLQKKDPLTGAYADYIPIDQIETNEPEKTTNKHGVVMFNRLPSGEYRIIETNTLDGYMSEPIFIDRINENNETIIKEYVCRVDQETRNKECYRDIIFDDTSEGMVQEVWNKKLTGSLEITKLDFNQDQEGIHNPIENAEFKLQKQNDKGEYIDYKAPNKDLIMKTDDQGKLIFNDLELGNYRIIEVSAPEGFINDPVYEDESDGYFTVDKDHLVLKVDIKNKKEISEEPEPEYEGSIEITKVDNEDQSLLQGAKFKLKKLNYLTNEYEEYQAPGQERIKETNEKGIVIFEKLEEGDYLIVEVEAPEGYTDEVIFEGNTNGEFIVISNDKLTQTVKNIKKPIEGSLEITKVDAEDGTLLEGVQFKLQKRNNENKYVDYQAPDQDLIKETNKKGIVIFEKLEAGDYRIVEVEAPEGYTDEVIFEGNTNGEFIVISNDKLTQTVKNKKIPIKGSIEITKKDEKTKALLSGAAFKLQKYDPILKEYVDYQAPNQDKIQTTGKDGTVKFENLDEGDYKIVEHKAPNDYHSDPKFDGDKHESGQFTISKEKTDHTQTVLNKKIVFGSIKVIKKDAKTGEVLQGAKFKLQRFNEEKNIYEDYREAWHFLVRKTKDNGEIQFTKLPEGKYRVVEVEAPVGYHSDPVYVEDYHESKGIITIDQDKENHIQTVTNTKIIKGHIEIIKKDADTKERLAGATFKLQKRNEISNIYEDYTAPNQEKIKETNGQGSVIFDNLEPGDYKIIEVKAPKGYTDEAIFIGNPNGEFIILDEVKITREVHNTKEPIEGTITIIKKDNISKEVLEGAKFKLQKYDEDKKIYVDYKAPDQDLIKTSNKNGEVTFNKLSEGQYKVIETEAPEGYQEYPIFVGENHGPDAKITINETVKDHTQVVENKEIIVGSITIIKKDNISKEVLEGAKFKLQKYDEDKKIYVDYKAPDQDLIKTSNKKGEVTFTKLLEGQYKVIETEVPEGYQEYPIFVGENHGSEGIFIVSEEHTDHFQEVHNIKNIKGSLEIIKTDYDTEQVLEYVKFKIQKYNMDLDTYEDYTAFNQDLIKETNEEGIVRFEDLEPGQYRIIETEALDGYTSEVIFVDNDEGVFSIDYDNTKISQKVQNKKIQAARTGSLEIIKKDYDTKELLEGVAFKLQKYNEDLGKFEDYTAPDQTLIKKTNQNGIVRFENLAQGRYKIVETEKLEGYTDTCIFVGNTEGIINISDQNNEITQEVLNIKIPKIVKGSLEIIKTDYETKEVLQGVKFKLQKYNPLTKVYEDYTALNQAQIQETNEKGIVRFENLEEGQYQVIETESLKGYTSDIIYKAGMDGIFTITKDKQNIYLEIENKKEIPAIITPPKEEKPPTIDKINPDQDTLPLTGDNLGILQNISVYLMLLGVLFKMIDDRRKQ